MVGVGVAMVGWAMVVKGVEPVVAVMAEMVTAMVTVGATCRTPPCTCNSTGRNIQTRRLCRSSFRRVPNHSCSLLMALGS